MHFFKRLEIHGFKSFANKTSLELLPGITVIVGPNGCGKSNVFDSIRWVLGESRAKSLRGERMDDVIFGGSTSVKATGFAKVDLVLNNNQKLLPIDFSEVVVGRSIFRTGETEYRINKSSCRRKDVTGLFLDTGIGTDGYSVMEQGRVSQIINARPLERRAIFDEAAGIARYKMHKEDATRRLERTHNDLERLNDVVFEVRKQVSSLKRQAGKAARFKTLNADLFRVESLKIARQWCDLRCVLSVVEEECVQIHKQLTDSGDQRDRADRDLLTLRGEVEKATSGVEERQGELFSIMTESNDIQSKITIANQRVEMDAENARRITVELDQLSETTDKLTAMLGGFDQEIDNYRLLITSLQEECESQKKVLDEKKAIAGAVVGKLSECRKKCDSTKDSISKAENDAGLAKTMSDRLKLEIVESDVEYGNLELNVLQSEESWTEGQKALTLSEQGLSESRDKLAECAIKLVNCENGLKKVSDELDTVRKKAHEADSRHKALADLQDNYEGYFRGVREVMIAGRNGRLSGLCGVVSELFSATAALELAIEIALGARAQDIVTLKSDDAKKAIRFLKEKEFGRATFLSLDIIRPRGDDTKLQKYRGYTGVLGPAIDLVTFDEKYMKVAKYLFGGVLVVENLDVAVSLTREGLQTKMVTLQGDMVDPHGAMTGGSVKSSGLLYRTRQILELEQSSKSLAAEVIRLEAKAGELRDLRRELREQHMLFNDTVTKCTIESNRCRNTCQSLERVFKEKTVALEKAKGKRESVRQDILSYEKRLETATEKIAVLTQELAVLGRELGETEEQTRADQLAIAGLQNDLHQLLIKYTSEREKLNSLVERQANTRRELISVAERQSARIKEQEQIGLQDAEIRNEIALLNTALHQCSERAKSLEVQVKMDIELRNRLNTALHEQHELVAKINRDYNVTSNAYNDCEMKRQEKELLIQSLTGAVEEHYPGQTIEHLLAQAVTACEHAKSGVEEASDVSEDDDVLEEKALKDVVAKSQYEKEHPIESVMTDLTSFDCAYWAEKFGDEDELQLQVNRFKDKIARLGPINMSAIEEYTSLSERLEFLQVQLADLEKAASQLIQTIQEIDATSTKMFLEAFEIIKKNFQDCYRRLFGGGNADLILTQEDSILDCGIDIEARPPGKKNAQISLLSGGEQAMTAIALLFGIFMFKPSPFCILDEIDAPLDDKNIERFKEMVRQFSHTTQFIIITHNKSTMTLANTIYGVTMPERGVSRVVSIKLDDFEESALAKGIK